MSHAEKSSSVTAVELPILDQPVSHDAAADEGWIHSFETSAGLDGPGLRLVFFLSGCMMRCLYCHNPDTWKPQQGRRMSVDELAQEARRYAPLLRQGGVTFTGGEPLMQVSFLRSALRRMKEEGFHTALDTAGFLGDRVEDAMLEDIDLVLLDIKHWDPEHYLHLTGKELEPTLRFARRLAEKQRPVWLRYVLVPGLTDQSEQIEGLASFAASLGNIERVDVLPFHQMGKTKWKELGLKYELDALRAPTAAETVQAVNTFARFGLHAV